MKSTVWNCVLIFTVLLVAAVFAATSSEYHLANSYKFAAPPGGREYFDYITFDPEARRLFLSHGTEVLVVDPDSGKEEGKITGLKVSHGVAVIPELGRGFISDGAQGKAIAFDLKTFQIVGEANAAPDADCIIYDPASKHIFTFNGDSHNAIAIDPATTKDVGTVELGGSPEFAVADGQGTIYNNLEDKSEVLAIDSRSLHVKSRWPIAPAGAPAPIAMDREHRRLFIAGREPPTLVVMNADDGKVIQSFPISQGADAEVYDSITGSIFVSTREGWVHIFHEDSPDHFSVAGKVKTEFGAKTMAYDPKTERIFVDTAEFRKAPAPTPEHPRSRPAAIPGTFHLLVYVR
ncbi:MAG: YncE family protein [Acidobacteria bacterium]|nr:YncE family protein [Acidobacteriota bacterium]MBV9625544.1 YncE family protein [Acidobacteriota bacterium]